MGCNRWCSDKCGSRCITNLVRAPKCTRGDDARLCLWSGWLWKRRILRSAITPCVWSIVYTLSLGIQVNSLWTYKASFYYKFPVASSFNGSVTVALQSNGGDVYASASVAVNGSQTSWKQIKVSLKPTSSPTSTENSFTVTFNGTSAANQVIHFAMFSLFPPTYKGRENGLRIDLATVRVSCQLRLTCLLLMTKYRPCLT